MRPAPASFLLRQPNEIERPCCIWRVLESPSISKLQKHLIYIKRAAHNVGNANFFPNYVLVKKQFKKIYPEKSEKPKTTVYARENL